MTSYMGRGEEARELMGKQMTFRKGKWALKRTGEKRGRFETVSVYMYC